MSIKQNIDFNDYGSRLYESKKLSDYTDMEIAAHLIQNRVHTHAIISRFDKAELLAMPLVGIPYGTSAVMESAVARMKRSASAASSQLTSALQKSPLAVLTATKMIVTVTSTPTTFEIERGTVMSTPEIKKEALRQHSFAALVQLYKPVKNQDGVIVPVITDDKEALYPNVPRPTGPLAALYSRAAQPRDVVEEFMKHGRTLTSSGKDMATFYSVPAMTFDRLRGPDRLVGLTKCCTPAPAKTLEIYKKLGVKCGVSFAYAPPPKVVTSAATVSSAYGYLALSRQVRGEGNKGIAFGTANYYYGDLPDQIGRTVSIAHNLVYLAETVKKRKLEIDAIYDYGFSSWNVAFEVVPLNTPVVSYGNMRGKYAKYDSLSREHYKYGSLETGKHYLVPIDMPRQGNFSKNALFFTPKFDVLEDAVKIKMAQIDEVARDLKCKFTYVVHTRASDEILERYNTIYSLHAHAGAVWYFPTMRNDAVGVTPAAIAKRKLKFWQRMVYANCFKNYYPFHRVPFCTVDVARDFVLVLKRSNDEVLEGLKFDFEAEPEGVPEQIVDEELLRHYLEIEHNKVVTALDMNKERFVEEQDEDEIPPLESSDDEQENLEKERDDGIPLDDIEDLFC